MGQDFFQMWQSGRDLWRGQYTGLYPLPANGLFALLALLPYQVALVVMASLGLALFVAAFRRWALMWILFQPILAGLWLGQLDLFWLWFLRHGSPVALALLTLKPQLFPLAIPALWSDRSKWRPFGLACLALYGPVTLVRPTWPLEWLRQCDDGRVGWDGSTSILAWPLVGFAALLAVAALGRLDWRAVFWTCNTTIRWYDFTMLAGASLWLVPLSWILFGASQALSGHPAPFALLGVADAILRGKKNRQRPTADFSSRVMLREPGRGSAQRPEGLISRAAPC